MRGASDLGQAIVVVRTCLVGVLSVALHLTGAEPDPNFAEDLYPRLEAQNCRACHNPSGVASGTRLLFPESGASDETVTAFGLQLAALVDTVNVANSPLLLKPTNRVPHTGGPLIAVGSEDERVLLSWVEYLAAMPGLGPDPARRLGKRPAEPLRRLTHVQYDNTVRDLLADRTRPGRSFPAEDFVNGYTNQASSQGVTGILAEAYGRAAAKLARNAFRYGDENGLIPCDATGPSDRNCAERFVRQLGMEAYRRPLAEAELDAYVRLHLQWASHHGDFLAGAAAVVEAMLQSPHFLFLPAGPADGTPGQFALASRLSYAITNTMPDRELLEQAARGRLATRSDVEAQARRLVETFAAKDALDEFLAQWLRFDRLLNAVKDRNAFREYSPQVAESMAEETRLLFRHLVWSDLDFREFFRAEYTFADDFLTRIYGMPDPRDPFGRTEYPSDSTRAGILGHGTFLAQTGKPLDTSPTERGLFVREHFLCQEIPPPPPGVDASLPALALGSRPMTSRELMETLHASDTTCASCHKLVDPIGYGFEHFDTVGSFRATEPVRVEPTPQQERQGMKAETHELGIDSSGYIAGIENSAFRSPREAGRILADSEVCQKCIVKQLLRYFFGRHETRHDAELIDRAYNRFKRTGFQFRELVLGLVVSEEFLQAGWSD